MLMRCKSVIDSVLHANGITAIFLVLIVTVNSVWAIEHSELNVRGNFSIANSTKSASAGTSSTSFNATENGISSPKVLSRRKRYIAFPEGSSFSVSFNNLYNSFELFAANRISLNQMAPNLFE